MSAKSAFAWLTVGLVTGTIIEASTGFVKKTTSAADRKISAAKKSVAKKASKTKGNFQEGMKDIKRGTRKILGREPVRKKPRKKAKGVNKKGTGKRKSKRK